MIGPGQTLTAFGSIADGAISLTCAIHGTKMSPGPACGDGELECFECFLATPAPKPPKPFVPGLDAHGQPSIRVAAKGGA
jgi:hypothetical protein